MQINHNISAKLANFSLQKTNRKLTASLESLSSGYRINKAADDSAGLAISNTLRTQLRALDQSSRNADDGQSIIQTVEGAMTEVHSMLQRMRELSVQAANDTYTVEDRYAMQKEIDELLDEIDRIGETTEFNGQKLLDGSHSRLATYSANGFNTISISKDVQPGEYEINIGSAATQAEIDLDYGAEGETRSVQINGSVIEFKESESDEESLAKIKKVCDAMDIDVVGGGGSVTLTSRACGQKQFIEIKDVEGNQDSINGTDVEASCGEGFTEDVVCTTNGKTVTIRDSSGFQIDFTVDENASSATMVVYDTGTMMLQIGANEHQNLSIDFPELSCRTLNLRDSDGICLTNVCSRYSATNAIDVFDDAICTVSAMRSSIGAYQNRLDTTLSSLDVSIENMTDSFSRIMDTNMATAMTNYTQENVLLQASTAMLAQANNRPQQVMSLLQS